MNIVEPERSAAGALRAVLVGLGIALGACGDSVIDPPDDEPAGSSSVATITFTSTHSLLTVLGSTTRLTLRARDGSGAVLCSVPSLGCSPRLLDKRFQWKMDVPGVVSLEEYDMGIYPNGGAYLTARAAGRVEITASLDGVEGKAVVDVVERARVAWTVRTMGASAGIAIGEDGTIYMAGRSGLQAVGAQGDVRWSAPVQAKGIPAIAEDGTLYVGTGDGLFAVDRGGNVRWVTPIKLIASAPAIGPDGTIYQVTLGGTLYAVDAFGRIKWHFEAPGGQGINSSSPAIGDDGMIYFGSEDHHLHAIGPDGKERWRFRTDGVVQSPSIGGDGTIYFGSNRTRVLGPDGYTVQVDSRMHALTPDGTERWRARLDGDVWAGPAIGFDGTVYMGTANGGFIYVFARDGSLLRKVGGGMGHTPIVAGDGSIALSFGAVAALDGAGAAKWTFQPENGASPAPAIGFDGMIYAGASDRSQVHTLYAFEEPGVSNGGYKSAPWPQERGDRANTGRAPRRP